MTINSMDVEFLQRLIASLEVALQEREDDVLALEEWIEKKKAQCVKCRAGRKLSKEAIAQQKAMDCGCGGNCQVEGEDCR